MDEGEDIPVIAAQQLPQVRAAGGVALVPLARGDGAASLEGLGDLVVQLRPVGHHDEGPVTRDLAQDLLGEEDHGQGLAAPLRLPEDAAAPVALFARREHGADGAVDSQVLVVLGEDLHEARLALREEDEILHEVQEAPWLAGPPQEGLQRDAARLLLAGHALPFEEAVPVRGE